MGNILEAIIFKAVHGFIPYLPRNREKYANSSGITTSRNIFFLDNEITFLTKLT